MWNVRTTQLICELPMQNHWVRALSTSDKFLYSGSYQAVKVSHPPLPSPSTPITLPSLHHTLPSPYPPITIPSHYHTLPSPYPPITIPSHHPPITIPSHHQICLIPVSYRYGIWTLWIAFTCFSVRKVVASIHWPSPTSTSSVVPMRTKYM